MRVKPNPAQPEPNRGHIEKLELNIGDAAERLAEDAALDILLAYVDPFPGRGVRHCHLT